MDVEGYAERLIAEALTRGDLQPIEGTGEPLPRLENDPGWWIRDFLEREGLPDRFADTTKEIADLTAEAIAASDLDEGRRILRRANHLTASWNEDAPSEYRLPMRSEIWLLDQRAGRPVD